MFAPPENTEIFNRLRKELPALEPEIESLTEPLVDTLTARDQRDQATTLDQDDRRYGTRHTTQRYGEIPQK